MRARNVRKKCNRLICNMSNCDDIDFFIYFFRQHTADLYEPVSSLTFFFSFLMKIHIILFHFLNRREERRSQHMKSHQVGIQHCTSHISRENKVFSPYTWNPHVFCCTQHISFSKTRYPSWTCKEKLSPHIICVETTCRR